MFFGLEIIFSTYTEHFELITINCIFRSLEIIILSIKHHTKIFILVNNKVSYNVACICINFITRSFGIAISMFIFNNTHCIETIIIR